MFKRTIQYLEPWYLGYAFQGAVILGLVPIALPLYVGLLRGPVDAGIIIAVFYLSQFVAPFLGTLADKFNLRRPLYLISYILIALGCLAFPLNHIMLIWMVLAVVIGLGVALANTLTGMFIVEFHPKPEWDQRIGWLQTSYGTGQAVGLLLAAVLGKYPNLALYLSAVLMIPGLYFGLKKLPHKKAHIVSSSKNCPAHWHHMQLRPHSATDILNYFHPAHKINWRKLLTKAEHNAFLFYIVTIFLIMLSIWLVFNLYPLLMLHAYHVSAGFSSLYYAIGACIGILAYPFSGNLAKKIGDLPVLLIGAIMVTISWFGMGCLAYFHTTLSHFLLPLFFILTPIAWSPLIVVGTAIAPKLSLLSDGEAIGIFNATVAIASFIGALLAGYIADLLGYTAVVWLAALVILSGVFCILVIRKKNRSKPCS